MATRGHHSDSGCCLWFRLPGESRVLGDGEGSVDHPEALAKPCVVDSELALGPVLADMPGGAEQGRSEPAEPRARPARRPDVPNHAAGVVDQQRHSAGQPRFAHPWRVLRQGRAPTLQRTVLQPAVAQGGLPGRLRRGLALRGQSASASPGLPGVVALSAASVWTLGRKASLVCHG
jgi:hypothetical protein